MQPTWSRVVGSLALLLWWSGLLAALDVKGALTASGALIAQSFTCPVTTTSTALTLTTEHCQVHVTTGTANIPITLPAAAGLDGREFRVLKVDAPHGSVVMTPTGSDTIQGDNAPVSFTGRGTRVTAVWESATGWALERNGLSQYLAENRPPTCTPGDVIVVPNSTTCRIQVCDELAEGWACDANPEEVQSATLMNLPWRPAVASTTIDITLDLVTFVSVDTTDADVNITVPDASDVTKPGVYKGSIKAGTNCLNLVLTEPNIFRGVEGNYPPICGLQAGFNLWRVSGNEWYVEAIVPPAKRMIQWSVAGGKPPATDAAEINQATIHPSLRFDAATKECMTFPGHLPSDFEGNLEAFVDYTMVNDLAAGLTLSWGISFLRQTPNVNILTDTTYDTENTCDVASVPDTPEFLEQKTCPLTTIDGLVADSKFLVKLCRIVAGKTSTGDARVIGFGLRYNWK